MKRLALSFGILALTAPLAVAQTSTWVPDKAHSEVDFTILHMSLSKVHGRFGNIGGKLVIKMRGDNEPIVTDLPKDGVLVIYQVAYNKKR